MEDHHDVYRTTVGTWSLQACSLYEAKERKYLLEDFLKWIKQSFKQIQLNFEVAVEIWDYKTKEWVKLDERPRV